MKWKINYWEFNEKEDTYKEQILWASTVFEAYGLFSSCVWDDTCIECTVTAYYSDEPYSNNPIFAYKNPFRRKK